MQMGFLKQHIQFACITKKKKKKFIILDFIPGMVLFSFTFFDLQENAGRPLSNSACGVY